MICPDLYIIAAVFGRQPRRTVGHHNQIHHGAEEKESAREPRAIGGASAGPQH